MQLCRVLLLGYICLSRLLSDALCTYSCSLCSVFICKLLENTVTYTLKKNSINVFFIHKQIPVLFANSSLSKTLQDVVAWTTVTKAFQRHTYMYNSCAHLSKNCEAPPESRYLPYDTWGEQVISQYRRFCFRTIFL